MARAIASPAVTFVPLQASVLFLRIAGYPALAPADRGRQRERLLHLLAQVVPKWPVDGRVVLEGEDGAAIVSLDDPGRAMDTARRIGRRGGFEVGLHHGPVRPLEEGGATVLAGDGIETARVVAGLSQAHPVVATREFRQALRAAAPDRADALEPAGTFVDERFRAYELYVPDAQAARRRRLRRTLLGAGTVTVILGLGLWGRARRRRREGAGRGRP